MHSSPPVRRTERAPHKRGHAEGSASLLRPRSIRSDRVREGQIPLQTVKGRLRSRRVHALSLSCPSRAGNSPARCSRGLPPYPAPPPASPPATFQRRPRGSRPVPGQPRALCPRPRCPAARRLSGPPWGQVGWARRANKDPRKEAQGHTPHKQPGHRNHTRRARGSGSPRAGVPPAVTVTKGGWARPPLPSPPPPAAGTVPLIRVQNLPWGGGAGEVMDYRGAARQDPVKGPFCSAPENVCRTAGAPGRAARCGPAPHPLCPAPSSRASRPRPCSAGPMPTPLAGTTAA